MKNKNDQLRMKKGIIYFFVLLAAHFTVNGQTVVEK